MTLACDYRPSPVFSILTTLKKSEHGQHSAAVGVTSPFNLAAPEAQLPSNNRFVLTSRSLHQSIFGRFVGIGVE